MKKIARRNISQKFPLFSIQYIDNVLLESQVKRSFEMWK